MGWARVARGPLRRYVHKTYSSWNITRLQRCAVVSDEELERPKTKRGPEDDSERDWIMTEDTGPRFREGIRAADAIVCGAAGQRHPTSLSHAYFTSHWAEIQVDW